MPLTATAMTTLAPRLGRKPWMDTAAHSAAVEATTAMTTERDTVTVSYSNCPSSRIPAMPR